jgi:hypothetical protein
MTPERNITMTDLNLTFGPLEDLQPSLEAIMEVAQVHEQLDPPTEPLQLSIFASNLLQTECYEPCWE